MLLLPSYIVPQGSIVPERPIETSSKPIEPSASKASILRIILPILIFDHNMILSYILPIGSCVSTGEHGSFIAYFSVQLDPPLVHESGKPSEAGTTENIVDRHLWAYICRVLAVHRLLLRCLPAALFYQSNEMCRT